MAPWSQQARYIVIARNPFDCAVSFFHHTHGFPRHYDFAEGTFAEYLEVFRVTGTVAFACFAMSLPQRSIWYRQSWLTTAKSMFDGLVYACLMAGTFGWLWPA